MYSIKVQATAPRLKQSNHLGPFDHVSNVSITTDTAIKRTLMKKSVNYPNLLRRISRGLLASALPTANWSYLCRYVDGRVLQDELLVICTCKSLAERGIRYMPDQSNRPVFAPWFRLTGLMHRPTQASP